MKRRRMWLVMIAAVSLLAVAAAVLREEPFPSRESLIPAAGTYDVRILRDSWGVPHVF